MSQDLNKFERLKGGVNQLNQSRIKYFTAKNKPLSIAIALFVFVLIALAKPLIAIVIIAVYGVVYFLLVGNVSIKEKLEDIKNNLNKK